MNTDRSVLDAGQHTAKLNAVKTTVNDKGSVIAKFIVAGIDKKDITINLENNILNISGDNGEYIYNYDFVVQTDRRSTIVKSATLENGILSIEFIPVESHKTKINIQ